MQPKATAFNYRNHQRTISLLARSINMELASIKPSVEIDIFWLIPPSVTIHLILLVNCSLLSFIHSCWHRAIKPIPLWRLLGWVFHRLSDSSLHNLICARGNCELTTHATPYLTCQSLPFKVLGYRVVASSSTAVKQDYNEYMWTMRKEFNEPEPPEVPRYVVPHKKIDSPE